MALEKLAGADLKASDRLKEVEERLRGASDDMDTARKEYNKKKRNFDVVAKNRYACIYLYIRTYDVGELIDQVLPTYVRPYVHE